MNYKNVYNQLIENRKSNPLSTSAYGETHHIIPRSLGGDDSSENLVKLSAREHFVAHALLSEIYEPETIEWYKMNHAFMMMKMNGIGMSRYLGSRFYELKRADFSKVMSWVQKGKKNSQYGTCWIRNLELEENKKILKEELQSWLDNGWERGRCIDFKAYKEKVCKKMDRTKLTRKNIPEGIVGYVNGYAITKSKATFAKKIFNIDLQTNFNGGIDRLRHIIYDKPYSQVAKEFNCSKHLIYSWNKILNKLP